MSLVAYDYGSSDDESENDDEEETNKAPTVPIEKEKDNLENINSKDTLNEKAKENKVNLVENIESKESLNGHISDDEDDDYDGKDVGIEELKDMDMFRNSISLLLPKPKKIISNPNEIQPTEEEISLTFSKLPMPKASSNSKEKKSIVEEEDDEFLRKKAEPEKIVVEKPPVKHAAGGTVKIKIPSLNDFRDVEQDLKNKAKNDILKGAKSNKGKGSSLLGLLPTAKSERTFTKSVENNGNKGIKMPSPSEKSIDNPHKDINSSLVSGASKSLVPDAVRNKRPGFNTEGVDGIKSFSKKTIKPFDKTPTISKENTKKVSLSNDSDHSDEEDGEDFFSLKTEFNLPEVSHNEISSLVAKKAAKMADVTNRFLAATAEKDANESATLAAQEEESREAQKRHNEQTLNYEAMQALVGSTAKRRKQTDEIQIMDISSDQVLPDRAEWMRTALASSTEYQPTGVLVDEEPASGTKRKHQITYLAHKAKANEAELQAMWAANRQNRRATQSKYGF